MSYESRERKEGTGVLLSNKFKKTASAPDWKGEMKLERAYAAGEIVKMAAWTKETAHGALISLKEDNFRREESGGNTNPFPSKRSDDGDVPF